MSKYTPQQIMDARPCRDYDLDCVTELWGGEDALTTTEIAELDIPAEDRFWAMAYVCLDDVQCRLLACDCAERALDRVDNPDPRSVEAIAVSRRYARGEATRQELSVALDAARSAARSAALDAAWDAARSAARDAAWYAARSAAGYAARSAAQDAAGYAAWYAARSAARSVALDAAWDAAWEWQIGRAVEYAEGVRSYANATSRDLMGTLGTDGMLRRWADTLEGKSE